MNEHVIEHFGITSDLTFVNVTFETLRETFGVQDFALANQSRIVSEVFGATDSATGAAYLLASEVFGVLDEFSVAITARKNVRELFQITTRTVSPVVRVGATASDVFGATDGTYAPTIGAKASETFGITDAASTALGTTRTVTERFGVGDRAYPKRRAYASEVFNTRASYYIPTANRVVVYEKANFIDAALPVRALYVRVTEKMQVSGTFVPTQIAREVSSEIMTITDRTHERVPTPVITSDQLENLAVPVLRTDVWTADIRTWAMSRYVDFPLKDFISDQFGAGDDGMYTHNDGPVMAYVDTGLLRFDNREDRRLLHKKQLRYVYTYAEYTNPLHVLVTADLNGERTSVEYENTVQSSDDLRATRCEIGRGFASNYVKLRIGARSKFAISAVEVESVVSSRRV